MAMTKERERPQWREVSMFPKRRQDWRLSSKRRERRPHGTQNISLTLSMRAEKSASMQGANRSTSPRSENSVVHPHQGRASWLLDARKPKPNLGLRHTLTEAVRETSTTEWSFTSSQQQERVLLAERSALLDLENADTISDAQATRLRQVEAQLDRLEDQDPVEQEADRRLAQTGDKLDEILSLLRSLPRKEAQDCIR
jgi:hypothetical protein